MSEYLVKQNNCLLCERELGEKTSTHHLIPVLKGGRKGETVELHKICHDKIHSVFTERELQIKYNTIEKLLEHTDIQIFVKWVKSKSIDFYDGSKQNKRKH